MLGMELLGAVVLVLLTLVGFSSGITLAVKRRPFALSILDLVMGGLICMVAFWLRPQINRWLLLASAVVLGIVVGYILAALRLSQRDSTALIPKSELPEHAREREETAVSPNVFKRIWFAWNDFAARMGNVQGRLLMGYFYFIIVTPFGILTRLFMDPLNIKHEPDANGLCPKEPTDTTIEAAREQG